MAKEERSCLPGWTISPERWRPSAAKRRRSSNGIPPIAGTSTCGSPATARGFTRGTPIGRPALVKLFASVLKREGGRYVLVTPVEKCGITVDDVPFVAVELDIDDDPAGRRLRFRTNVDDWVVCGPGHALRFESDAATGGLRPYVHVRRDLWARVSRALYYDLVGPR